MIAMALPLSFAVLGITIFLKVISSERVCIVDSAKSNSSGVSTDCDQVLESINDLNTARANLNIVFYNGTHILSKVLLFENTVDISISSSSEARIVCDGLHSALAFKHSRNIRIERLSIEMCGSVFNSTSLNLTSEYRNETMNFLSAVYFEACTNVELLKVAVERSQGVGVTVYNTNGTIRVLYSEFRSNKVPGWLPDFPGGGGMYIEFSVCVPGSLSDSCGKSQPFRDNACYEIRHCIFESNVASTINLEKGSFVKIVGDENHGNHQELGRGGGLGLFFAGSAKNNSIEIANCYFMNNKAVSGGGLMLSLSGYVTNNSVFITNSKFVGNDVQQAGGGAVIQCTTSGVRGSRVKLHGSKISNNSAINGGGLLLLYNHLEMGDNTSNAIEIHSTLLSDNFAEYGAAVDSLLYAPAGYNGPYPTFTNCSFVGNYVVLAKSLSLSDLSDPVQVTYGVGTFTVSKMTIVFKDSVTFKHNTGCALWAVSSRLIFSSNVVAHFENNTGIQGGAMGLVSLSLVQVQENSTLSFVRNKALVNGGAIYSFFPSMPSLLHSATLCPIQYYDSATTVERNVMFYFEDNYLLRSSSDNSGYGRSIFMPSLQPCVFFCMAQTQGELSIEKMFSCLGNYVFNSTRGINGTFEVSTAGRQFSFENGSISTLFLTPGKVFDLPLVVVDDLGHSLLGSVIHVHIEHGRDKIVLDPAYKIITQHTIKVYGAARSNGTIVFTLAEHSHSRLSLKIELLPCPPGLYENKLPIQEHGRIIHRLRCTCNWDQTSRSIYNGIYCNSNTFQAKVQHTVWVGYIVNNVLPEHLATSLCPQHFCYSGQGIEPLHILPASASFEELNRFVCGPNRRGILCGECSKGYSVFFHSENHKCMPNKLCQVGWIFYLLSEILPLTAMFIIIVLLNVNFSSGALNGFILFAQVLDSLSIGASGMLEFQLMKSRPLFSLTKLYKFVYRTLNLDFFTLDALSYCLWEGATTLGLLSFKYVTVFYAFVLILVSVFVLNKCQVRLCQRIRLTSIRSYVIHGLSAFLITCYVKCAQIFFQILVPGRLRGMEKQSSAYNPVKVVFYSGHIDYLSRDHLPYAFPAIIVALIVCVPPPFFLIWYPLGRQAVSKATSKCSRGVSCSVNLPHRCSSFSLLDKMKPLLDSFQSCYKDKCRFFAGLQFLYRLIILGTYNFSYSPLVFYILIDIEMVLMLFVHVLFRPYHKVWHNVLDCLVYVNIALVNSLTLLIYIFSNEFEMRYVFEAIVLQTILIYLPLVYIIIYCSVMVYKLVKAKTVRRKQRTTTSMDDGFPARLIESTLDPFSSDYELHRK